MKILLAMDTTAESQVALGEVAGRPWPKGSQVEALSVVDLSVTWNAPGLADSLMQSAEEAVRCAAERLKSAGIESASLVLTGNPRMVVVDRAAAMGADLIVVGSHEASDAVRFLLGSVARAVVRSAPCSVEIVRPRSGSGAMKILLATDGSKFSEAATQAVLAQYRSPETEVRVLCVVTLPTLTAPPQMAASYAPELQEQVNQAREIVDRAVDTLRKAGLRASGEVIKGDVRDVIIELAKEIQADLIVLGSHGRTGAGRWLMGSVAEAVVRHAPCSVEVVRIPQA
jgi:nucleotide-binding universal stress UspA family protein